MPFVAAFFCSRVGPPLQKWLKRKWMTGAGPEQSRGDGGREGKAARLEQSGEKFETVPKLKGRERREERERETPTDRPYCQEDLSSTPNP